MRAHSSVLERERQQVEEETQQTLTHLIKPKTKYDHKHPKQILAQEVLVDFIADDLIPLSVDSRLCDSENLLAS